MAQEIEIVTPQGSIFFPENNEIAQKIIGGEKPIPDIRVFKYHLGTLPIALRAMQVAAGGRLSVMMAAVPEWLTADGQPNEECEKVSARLLGLKPSK